MFQRRNCTMSQTAGAVLREWLIIDQAVIVLDRPKAIRIATCQDLLNHDLGRVQILRLSQNLGHAGAVLFLL